MSSSVVSLKYRVVDSKECRNCCLLKLKPAINCFLKRWLVLDNDLSQNFKSKSINCIPDGSNSTFSPYFFLFLKSKKMFK